MKLHGVTNYIDHHIENLKTVFVSDPNIECGESTIPKWHKTYARLNEVKSSLGCWGRSSSRVEAAAAAMTVRRANNFLALGFSSSCSDAGAGVCCLQNIWQNEQNIWTDRWMDKWKPICGEKKTPEHKLYVHCKLVGICTHHLLSRLWNRPFTKILRSSSRALMFLLPHVSEGTVWETNSCNCLGRLETRRQLAEILNCQLVNSGWQQVQCC